MKFNCSYTYYYCQGYKTDGKTVYHNSGKAMSSACSCLDCKKETTSETIVKYYCQGYCTKNGGSNLTGKSQYNCKPAGTFMKGKD